MPSVLVPGAVRGIGLAITRRMSEQGWDVYATARSATDLHDLGQIPGARPIELDITDRSAFARLPQRLPAALDAVLSAATTAR